MALPLFPDVPNVDPQQVSPSGAPINGKSQQSRHASYTGAIHANETRSANIWKLRQLWREPLTINDVAVLSRLPVSSVCSLKAAIEEELEFVDHELIIWKDDHTGKSRTTKRSRWRLKASQ